ncbi:MAG: alpha-1,3-galactosidase B [Parabacteroides sp.]
MKFSSRFHRAWALLPGLLLLFTACSKEQIYHLSDYGLTPGEENNSSPVIAAALKQIAASYDPEKPCKIILPKGCYHFYPEASTERVYYISNHDQDNPKQVGLAFEHWKNIVFDGQGSDLIFHGRMLPVSLIHSENCTLKNFSIDFAKPHIGQVQVLYNDTANAVITYEIAPNVDYEVRDSVLYFKGEGWELTPGSCIAFEEKTRRLIYQTSDTWIKVKGIEEIAPRQIRAEGWKNPRLVAGSVLAMRGWERPAPGLFMAYDKSTTLENIQVHYAEGMGLLAEMSEDIILDGFSVCLRGEQDPRYFTTQADATHFSGCKGKIISRNGLYEGMMDDAINVHGTYLKVVGCEGDKTLIGQYMHPQSYGFLWGEMGDSVQFLNSKTMEITGTTNRIASIEAIDKPVDQGVTQFRITFEKALDPAIHPEGSYGIENLTWTPEVLFEKNTIRNNRARGSLFSTPRPTVVQYNLFDHTSGTAILLCGDCNGWFETGACHDVLIRRNRFVNSLTNMFQFTNAIISIYPEIPDLEHQQQYFHSNIVIEENDFETFDQPIVYAKSVDGLVFRRNTIQQNNDYPAFHWNNHRFLLEHVTNWEMEENHFDGGFDGATDLINK